MSNSRRIAAHYLLNSGEVLARPIITVDERGVVTDIGVWERLDTMPATEFYAGALCAGFVNAHCHIELSYLRGSIVEGSGFAGFARAIGQVRSAFSLEERQRALHAADSAMWSEGVEAVGDIVNGDESFAMKSKSRITYHNFIEVFGLKATTEAARALLVDESCSLTPHSTYSVQESIFHEIGAEGSTHPLSIHFMESDDEAALYRGEGSLKAWYDKMGWECDFLHHGSPARRVIESLPHNRHLMLVHNCCCEEADLALIQEAFDDRVSWVVCPRSNKYISALRPPLELLRRRGARICVGTDSLASNHSLSMVEELKMMRHIPLRELIEWATINGAEALGIADTKGRVEKGKQAGLVLIEGIHKGERDELYLGEEATARRLV